MDVYPFQLPLPKGSPPPSAYSDVMRSLTASLSDPIRPFVSGRLRVAPATAPPEWRSPSRFRLLWNTRDTPVVLRERQQDLAIAGHDVERRWALMPQVVDRYLHTSFLGSGQWPVQKPARRSNQASVARRFQECALGDLQCENNRFAVSRRGDPRRRDEVYGRRPA